MCSKRWAAKERVAEELGDVAWALAVQAYQKRALPAIAWLIDLARRQRRVIPVRLVKGAYWDSEIKRGQELGLSDYPVFHAQKPATDISSYLACARALLSAPADNIFPQFATHNAHTLAAVQVFAGQNRKFEFQRLHGMGEALYELYTGVIRSLARSGAGHAHSMRPSAATKILSPIWCGDCSRMERTPLSLIASPTTRHLLKR